MARRKHSKIDGLPAELKDTVEQMMQTDFTYADIADFIKQQGHDISITSVWRHASNLDKTLKELRMVQENFRVVMDEINRYPQLDPTEAIARLLSHQVLMAIQKTKPEQYANMDIDKLLRESAGLIRAVSFKKRADMQNKGALDAGLEQVKVLVFEAMSKERPDLYAAVSKYLAEKGGAA
jgi:hypothetical protein